MARYIHLNPNMVRKWEQEFLQNAHLVFGADSERKAIQRKEDDLKKKNDQMLRTIGLGSRNIVVKLQEEVFQSIARQYDDLC